MWTYLFGGHHSAHYALLTASTLASSPPGHPSPSPLGGSCPPASLRPRKPQLLPVACKALWDLALPPSCPDSYCRPPCSSHSCHSDLLLFFSHHTLLPDPETWPSQFPLPGMLFPLPSRPQRGFSTARAGTNPCRAVFLSTLLMSSCYLSQSALGFNSLVYSVSSARM